MQTIPNPPVYDVHTSFVVANIYQMHASIKKFSGTVLHPSDSCAEKDGSCGSLS